MSTGAQTDRRLVSARRERAAAWGAPRPGWLRVVLALGLALLVAGAVAADGGALFREKGCHACHGADGSHPVSPDYPLLAGQNRSYLLRQMRDIRDGVRTNGLSGVMRATVTGVSDEEFAAIAEWLAEKL